MPLGGDKGKVAAPSLKHRSFDEANAPSPVPQLPVTSDTDIDGER